MQTITMVSEINKVYIVWPRQHF